MVGRSKDFWWEVLREWKVVGLLGLTLWHTTLTLIFPNGSRVRFAPYINNEGAARVRYGGVEPQGVFFDGAVNQGVREYLMERIRTHSGDVPVLGTRSTEDGAYRIFIGYPLFEKRA